MMVQLRKWREREHFELQYLEQKYLEPKWLESKWLWMGWPDALRVGNTSKKYVCSIHAYTEKKSTPETSNFIGHAPSHTPGFC